MIPEFEYLPSEELAKQLVADGVDPEDDPEFVSLRAAEDAAIRQTMRADYIRSAAHGRQSAAAKCSDPMHRLAMAALMALEPSTGSKRHRARIMHIRWYKRGLDEVHGKDFSESHIRLNLL